tara:strand:+ start:4938 stop:5453 length:516 start_codon:yes stop_codon:yes gene_type:complete
MNIRLFELDGRIVKPTEHCYMISWLNCIIEEYPKDHIKVLAYVYYMSYTGPDNPYANIVEEDREQKIMQSLEPEFDTEDPMIIRAIEKCTELYMTPTMRSYDAIKTMLDNLNVYLKTTPVTDGRDGNIGPLLRVAKEFKAVRESFKGVQDDVIEESKVKARGKSKLPYDMQ